MKTKTSKNWRKRLVIPGILLVIISIMIGVSRLIASPSHGHTTSTPGIVAKVQPRTIPKTEAPVTPAGANNYYDVTLPPSYKAQNGGEQTPGTLAQQHYVKASIDGSQLVVISIDQLPTSGLSQLSSYQLRSSGGRYVKTTKQVAGQTIEIFRDTQSASAVAFWPHGGVVATIGVNAGLQDMTDDANSKQIAAINEIVAGWKWHS